MKNVDEIAAETAEAILGNTADDTDKRITADIIKSAIEKVVAPTEHALVETRVKTAALQRELDQFQLKLDTEVARREGVERLVSRLKEDQAFDRAAREVWKKQLETATEFFKKSIK